MYSPTRNSLHLLSLATLLTLGSACMSSPVDEPPPPPDESDESDEDESNDEEPSEDDNQDDDKQDEDDVPPEEDDDEGPPPDDQGDEDDDPPPDEDDDGPEEPIPGCDGGNGSCVTVANRRLYVDGKAFHVKGVSWNPVPPGGSHPQSLDFAGYADEDIEMMRDTGINAVRTYEPILDVGVLNKLHDAGIYVINSVYPYGGSPVSLATDRVNQVKDHPAILMWLVGNEWNYNGLYTGNGDFNWAVQKVEAVAAAIQAIDGNHPVISSFGHVPTVAAINGAPSVDIWGANVYTGLAFPNVFNTFKSRTEKPLLISEYGADAFNATVHQVDLEAQAEATRVLTKLIFDNSSAYYDDGRACIGGTIYSWNDEWHKAPGPLDQQDEGGAAPGGGPYPDMVFNEEYWGLVDIYRVPRPALQALKEVYNSR